MRDNPGTEGCPKFSAAPARDRVSSQDEKTATSERGGWPSLSDVFPKVPTVNGPHQRGHGAALSPCCVGVASTIPIATMASSFEIFREL